MAELNTNWFDLKNYAKLNELDLIGWHRQISIRSSLLWFMDIADKNPADKKHIPKHYINIIKTNPIFHTYTPKDGDPFSFTNFVMTPKDNSTVNYTTAHIFWSTVNDEKFDNVLSDCALSLNEDLDDDQEFLIQSPVSILAKTIYDDDSLESTMFLKIDLQATEEQITKDFKNLLAKHRKLNKYNPPRKNFAEKDFTDWIQLRLLPYVDLYIVNKFEQTALTQAKVAWLIFSDDSSGIDIVDRFRRTTKPRAAQLFTQNIVGILERQIECNKVALPDFVG